jgi:hypothetical protein
MQAKTRSPYAEVCDGRKETAAFENSIDDETAGVDTHFLS